MGEQRIVTVYVGHADDDAHKAILHAVTSLFGGQTPRMTHACPSCGSSEHGRPIIVGSRDVSVSLARPRDAGPVVHAIARGAAVGIDVERVGAADFDGFDEVALHPQERCSDAIDRTRLWVRKEALLKAHGTGLITDPRSVLLAEDGGILEGPPGMIVDVDLGEGWQCAVAVTPPSRVRIERLLS